MLLEVNDIHKSFGETEILHGISFQVESGKALGLLGRNGAGKTTTIRILMDVFKANSGKILLDGKPFDASMCQIGYLPEERGLYPKKKVMEQLVFLAGLRGLSKKEAKKNAHKWLERLGVLEYENRNLETLSKGNQQKVQLAQTIVCNPDIVILDEPFSGLDPVNSQILKDVINDLIAEGKLVIFSSHQMGYVEEFCNDIVILNHGEVVLEGDLKEIKKDYGKNRLILSASNYTQKELITLIESKLNNYCQVYQQKKEFLILNLLNGVTKKSLMEELIKTDIDVEHFGVYEPTLTDIFVLKAGDVA